MTASSAPRIDAGSIFFRAPKTAPIGLSSTPCTPLTTVRTGPSSAPFMLTKGMVIFEPSAISIDPKAPFAISPAFALVSPISNTFCISWLSFTEKEKKFGLIANEWEKNSSPSASPWLKKYPRSAIVCSGVRRCDEFHMNFRHVVFAETGSDTDSMNRILPGLSEENPGNFHEFVEESSLIVDDSRLAEKMAGSTSTRNSRAV